MRNKKVLSFSHHPCGYFSPRASRSRSGKAVLVLVLVLVVVLVLVLEALYKNVLFSSYAVVPVLYCKVKSSRNGPFKY